jgi:hypothetical protein
MDLQADPAELAVPPDVLFGVCRAWVGVGEAGAAFGPAPHANASRQRGQA